MKKIMNIMSLEKSMEELKKQIHEEKRNYILSSPDFEVVYEDTRENRYGDSDTYVCACKKVSGVLYFGEAMHWGDEEKLLNVMDLNEVHHENLDVELVYEALQYQVKEAFIKAFPADIPEFIPRQVYCGGKAIPVYTGMTKGKIWVKEEEEISELKDYWLREKIIDALFEKVLDMSK